MFKERAHHDQTGGLMIDFLCGEGDPELVKEAGYTNRIAKQALGIAKNQKLQGLSVDLGKIVDDLLQQIPRRHRSGTASTTEQLTAMDRSKILDRIGQRINKAEKRHSAENDIFADLTGISSPRKGAVLTDARGYRATPQYESVNNHGVFSARQAGISSGAKRGNRAYKKNVKKNVRAEKKHKIREAIAGRARRAEQQAEKGDTAQLTLKGRSEQPGVKERLAEKEEQSVSSGRRGESDRERASAFNAEVRVQR